MGERKCGTSSLYRYLIRHPHILPCQSKEPQFFSQPLSEIEQNIDSYFSLFPLKESQEPILFEWPELNSEGILYHTIVQTPRNPQISYLTGEASANTFHQVAPQLLNRFLPDIKLIVIFRDPIERAFSHHRMFLRFQEEGRDLGRVIHDFDTDMHLEWEFFQQNQPDEFLTPGMYIRNLRKWEAVYGKKQILTLFSEELENNTQQTVDQVTTFLELPRFDYGAFIQNRFNRAPHKNMPPSTRYWLEEVYRPYDDELANHLGRTLPWNK